MALPRVIALALLAGLTVRADNTSTRAPYSMNVCVSRIGETWIIAQAEALAGRMFAEIGVSVAWYHDDHHCKAPRADFLHVALSRGESDFAFPGALAYTRLHDKAHIEVFYDRIVQCVEPREWSNLLAHVLAHEITHLLEDVNRHSSEGLMKARWDGNDMIKMSWKPLPFAAEDIDLIHHALIQQSLIQSAGNLGRN